LNAAGYSVSRSGNDFEFFTALGAAYVVSFVPAGEYLNNIHPLKHSIFRIDIDQSDPGPYNYPDFRVGITVAEIVYYFFEVDNRNVIFYICDPRDGRMKARQRKFEYWQRLFDDGNCIKIVCVIKTKSVEVQANFIFRKNNSLAYDLPAIIEEAKDNLSNK
jgi:hypothetical protein